MAFSIQDAPYINMPNLNCRLSSPRDLQDSFSSTAQIPSISQASPKPTDGTDPSDPSSSSPELDENVLDLRLPNIHPTHTLTGPEGLDVYRPDTRINIPSKSPTLESVIRILEYDKSLPDTQADDLDLPGHSGNRRARFDSRLLRMQRFALQSVHINESLHVHPDHFLTTAQNDTNKLKSQLPSLKVPYIPLSPAKSLINEELLPDTQTSIDGTVATSSTHRNSIQNNTYLSDTQVSLGNLEGFCPSTLRYSLKTGADDAALRSPLAITSIQNDASLPDTKVSSVGNFESSNSTQEFSLQTRSNAQTPDVQLPPSKQPLNKATCRERKRIVVSSNRPPALTKAMCQWIDKTNYLLDPFREDDDCWIHPSPPSGHVSMNGILRPCGKLQRRFNWKDRNRKHSLVLNFGIVCKLVNYKMTKQQKDGFTNKQWHLSHLCGNWTCLNPAHTTVEPGNVNISRNTCFSHRSGCYHNPPCMKNKKVSLGADGRPFDHNASVLTSIAPSAMGDWDDWSIQGFDDGEDFTVVDDYVDPESTSQNLIDGYLDLNDDGQETL